MGKYKESDFTIDTADSRGWYIYLDGSNDYLHHDGTLCFGVNGHGGGFWPSKNYAAEKLTAWIESNGQGTEEAIFNEVIEAVNCMLENAWVDYIDSLEDSRDCGKFEGIAGVLSKLEEMR